MAGVTLETLAEISPHAVRVMPNLAAMVGASMSVACAPHADTATRAQVTALFEAAGAITWVEDEALLTLATAISGSGPGYLFAFMEALETAAMAHGLDLDRRA
jgi:pyrroline-5-carboxylate reductase